ncbi:MULTISPECIES: aldo/keto reductase [Pseudomonas]|uniref:Oxidoreductase, aldo/keto reductase family n=2 Tax=Pseudomonas putida group TaxID=136845 RepID=Q88GP7_PSEPK|nr:MULTISPECIES: aldo/keto reductase [Pseudomonas]AAN69271.1 Oxidoreductase, aldo/keto reductase family [Pseudomonas putida KT2440]KMU97113.1 aldo/keto reductase [Pseudomonas putida]KMY30054.1 aldo/keto reductase [Pseudomonas putida]KMY30916.1 aldo/keto reductase [Pseudomonas putida]MBP2841548.1 aldo/keto reductase [Pseudomonas sp. PNP]
MQRLSTRTGLDLPAIGLGTWPMTGSECTQAVRQALDVGYRHIDTATAYENEAAVGQALRDSDVPREQIHLTTKVWWDRLEPKAMRQSLEDSLRALGTEQVDLFHIHWPGTDWDLARSIDTLVALRDEGKARHIGVANFPLGLLRQVVETLGAPLSAIQVEYHVLLSQQPLLDFARGHDLLLTAYTPLARGQAAAQPVIQAIARKHGVLPSQVALKWLLDQDGVAAIPKASSRENQLANLAALTVPLDDEDRTAIAGLPKDQRVVSPPFAPDWNS